MNGRRLICASIALALGALSAHAQTASADFGGAVSPGSGTTAIHNLATGSLHVPFIVDRNCDSGTACQPTVPTGQENDPVNIGTGADGVFDSTTAFNFDANHGADTTTVYLDSSREYHFTTFSLPASLKIRGKGTVPLVIHVQGDMHVDGIIDVSGGAGDAPTVAGGATPRGGVGVCGGKNGGDGGDNTTLTGRFGTKFDTSVACAGGGGAPDAASAAGGAGAGGTNPSVGTAGGAGAVSASTPGVSYSASYTDYGLPASPATQVPTTAGSGGGGGGYRTATANGGGGGAGGGALFIQVGGTLTIGSTGQIAADGGAGGGGLNSGEGCGGGGSGGSILIFTGGSLVDDGPNSPTTHGIHALGGNTASVPGGTGCGGGNGGAGAQGILRMVSVDGTPTGTGAEQPAPNLGFLGTTRYTLQPVVYYSPVIDTGLSNPNFNGVSSSESANGGTITYEVAGSNDGFVSDDTGYLSPANATVQVTGKRYLRYRVTLQAGSRTASPEVKTVALNYSVPELDYRIAGCARVNPRGPSAGPWWVAILLCWALALPFASRCHRARRRGPLS